MKTGTRLDVEIGWDGTRHRFRMNNASGTQVLSLYTDASSQTSNVWQHIICSWDLGTAGNRKIYIDGVDKTAQLVFTTGQTIHYESTNVYVIAGAAHTIAAFDLAEVYFTVPAAYFDLATAGNREKFRSAGGLPVDLGSDGSTPTGTQPYVYLKSPFSSFGVNSGSGGNFTTNGTGGTGYISTTPPP